MIKSYNRKVVGNMLFRKAETREAEAIRALYGHSYFLCERTIEICSVKENDDHTR